MEPPGVLTEAPTEDSRGAVVVTPVADPAEDAVSSLLKGSTKEVLDDGVIALLPREAMGRLASGDETVDELLA